MPCSKHQRSTTNASSADITDAAYDTNNRLLNWVRPTRTTTTGTCSATERAHTHGMSETSSRASVEERIKLPAFSTFISEDPIGWTSGQTNNYAYVGGDPINFADPLGLESNQNTEDILAGFGDALTLNLTAGLRRIFR